MTTETARRWRWMLLGLAIVAPAVVAAPAPVDQFIVQYRADAPERGNAAARKAMLDEAGRRAGVALASVRTLGIGASVVKVDRALRPTEAEAVVRQLRANPDVLFVQPDPWIGPGHGDAVPARAPSTTNAMAKEPVAASRGGGRPVPALVPDDALYSQQWNLFDPVAGINAPAAWELATGSGQVVAILSTGITPHSDLGPNLVAGYDFIGAEADGSPGDGDARDADPTDTGSCTDHGAYEGTSLAGIVAALANNAKGIAGVAFGAKVQPIRVLGSHCYYRSSDLADAIVWAAGGSVPDVPVNPTPARTLLVEASTALSSCSLSTELAVRAANAKGATVVASDESGIYPSNYRCDGVLFVASQERGGTAYPAGDVTAPIGNATDPITSTTLVTGAEGYGPAPNHYGTAGAHVAGIAALVQDASPAPLAPGAVHDLLVRTSRPRGCEGCTFVDAGNAVGAASSRLLQVQTPPAAQEGPGPRKVTFIVVINSASSAPVTFDFATSDGSAVAGTDFVPLNLPAQTIPAGQRSKSFDVTLLDDATGEFEEMFLARVTNVSGAQATGATASAMILDDDGDVPVYRGVALVVPVLPYAIRQYRFDVPLYARGIGVGASEYFSLIRDPADWMDCWEIVPETTWYQCGITAPLLPTYLIDISGSGNYEIFANYTDPNTLSLGDATVVEGDGGTKLLTFTATLSNAYDYPVTFAATTANGSAVAGTDFVALNGATFTLPAGSLSKTFTITVNGDTAIEPTEFFYVNLSNVVGAVVGDGQGTGYIINNDGPLLSINDIAVGEGNAGTKVMTFTVSLSKVAPGPVSYDISTQGGDAEAGVDYASLIASNQVIPQGQLSKTHSVTIYGDTTLEPTEVLLAYVRNPVGASVWDGQGTGYILNDDGPTLSVPDASVGEGNSGSKLMNVTVLLSQAAPTDVVFSLATANVSATAGSDYTALSLAGQVIPAGQTSKVFQIPIAGDTTIEANESFTVTLGSNPTGATLYDRQAIATIYNDDGPTLSVNDVTISEGNSGTKVATFTVFLSQVAPVPITYSVGTSNITATAGPDYVATSLSGEAIPAGQLSKTFTVTLNGDTTLEPNETFRVTLSNISAGATLFKYTGTGTITNDD
jgi:hypothetical protein